MIIRFVTCKVKKGKEAAFEEASAINRAGSIAEPGVLRFDLLRDQNEAGTYYLYEVYRDEAATIDHKSTAHYQTWRDTVADWMVVKRSSVACEPVAPTDPSQW